MFVVALNFASQISKQSGLVLTLETWGISVRSAVIVCVLDVRLLVQFVSVDILANCVLISVLLVCLYFILFTVFRYCTVVFLLLASRLFDAHCTVVVIVCGDNYIRLPQATNGIVDTRQHFWNITDFCNFDFGVLFCCCCC
jgi:hypothetical protein